MKLVFCAVILALAVAARAQDDNDYYFSDYHPDVGLFDYEENNDSNEDSKENIEVKQAEKDQQVNAEIQDTNDLIEQKDEPDDGSFDVLADYQFEDNRSNNDDKESLNEEEPMPDDAPELDADDFVRPLEDSINMKTSKENIQNGQIDSDDDMWGDVVEEEAAPLPVPVDKIGLELEGSNEEIGQPAISEESEKQPALQSNEESNMKDIIEETQKLLEESDNDFKSINYDLNSDEDGKSSEDVFSPNNDEDETPEKVLDDLNADLDKLFETFDKLSDDSKDTEKNDGEDDVQDYEEKFDRPYKEGYILSLRDEYENFDDSNLHEIFAEHANEVSKDNIVEKNEEVGEKTNNVNENNNESSTKTIPNEKDEVAGSIENGDENIESFDYSEQIDKLLALDDGEDNQDKIDDLIDEILRRSYGNDGLVDDQQPKNEDAEILPTATTVTDTEASQTSESAHTDASQIESAQTTETVVRTTSEDESSRPTVMVGDLTSSEYNDLMSQFAIAHGDELNVNSEDFAKNVAPIHITLSVDEPTVVTSPNFPNPYPVNNVVDWIFEGPGNGIELNVTQLHLNGALGDYLLVKPGGIDASGKDGLLFSFQLRSERRYRFTNVNRMFVRFMANPGMPFLTGFSFSARMIWPLPDVVGEDMPVPEPVLHAPKETLILNLAGVTLPRFQDIKPAFKELIADIAQEYITDNEIDEGLNTTSEVTQITKTAVCNIRWPNYETCVEVTFGVPLHYKEEPEQYRLNAEDLSAMWRTYIVKEEFAARLRELGITEYAIPNDRSTLMVWLVIAAGVVISMAMLGFALWRFSCFEDYTRMRAFNDADSVQNEKKNLDLYPTPHQTLPPLYSESDYKWADDKYDDSTRVDLGGFTNKSYVRDDLFEFDSDEDVITPRDRKGVISPRDVYEV